MAKNKKVKRKPAKGGVAPIHGVRPSSGSIPQVAASRTQIRILSPQARTNELFDLGDGGILPVDGFGGWEEVAIPGQVNLTDYAGAPTIKLDIPILFGTPDDYADNVGQDGKFMRLLRLGRQFENGDEPPVVQIFGAAMPFANGGNFIILGFDIDRASIEKREGGKLVRLALMMHVSEYSNPNAIKIIKRKKKKASAKGGTANIPPSHYTIKDGDTLQSIAMEFYADRSMWQKIAEINDIRDPRNLKPGRKIKLP